MWLPRDWRDWNKSSVDIVLRPSRLHFLAMSKVIVMMKSVVTFWMQCLAGNCQIAKDKVLRWSAHLLLKPWQNFPEIRELSHPSGSGWYWREASIFLSPSSSISGDFDHESLLGRFRGKGLWDSCETLKEQWMNEGVRFGTLGTLILDVIQVKFRPLVINTFSNSWANFGTRIRWRLHLSHLFSTTAQRLVFFSWNVTLVSDVIVKATVEPDGIKRSRLATIQFCPDRVRTGEPVKRADRRNENGWSIGSNTGRAGSGYHRS